MRSPLPTGFTEKFADLLVLPRAGIEQFGLDQQVARRGAAIVDNDHVELQGSTARGIGYSADWVKLECNAGPRPEATIPMGAGAGLGIGAGLAWDAALRPVRGAGLRGAGRGMWRGRAVAARPARSADCVTAVVPAPATA